MSIPHEAKYRLATIKFAKRFGVLRASANYHTSTSNIYRWMKLYEAGGIKALENHSRRPKSHPNAHTEAELKLVRDMVFANPTDSCGFVRLTISLPTEISSDVLMDTRTSSESLRS